MNKMIVQYCPFTTGAAVLVRMRYCHDCAHWINRSSDAIPTSKSEYNWFHGPGFHFAFKRASDFWDWAKIVGYGDAIYMAAFDMEYRPEQKHLAHFTPISRALRSSIQQLASHPRKDIRDHLLLTINPMAGIMGIAGDDISALDQIAPQYVRLRNGLIPRALDAPSATLLTLLGHNVNRYEVPCVEKLSITNIGAPLEAEDRIRFANNMWTGNSSSTVKFIPVLTSRIK